MRYLRSGTREPVDWKDLASPLVLLLTGLVLTSGACFEWLSFDRMENLWPAALLLSGLAGLVGPDTDNSR